MYYFFKSSVIIFSLTFSQGLYAMFDKDYAKFVGVGSIFIRDGKALLVLREKTGRNDNLYGLVGGLVKSGESVLHGALREIREEVGVEVKPEDMQLVHCISSREDYSGEVVGLYFLVKQWVGEPFNKKSDKHSEVTWFSLNELPKNIIVRNKQALEMMQKGIPYSEYGW